MSVAEHREALAATVCPYPLLFKAFPKIAQI